MGCKTRRGCIQILFKDGSRSRDFVFSGDLFVQSVDAPFGLGRGVSMADRVTLVMSGFKGKVFKDNFG